MNQILSLLSAGFDKPIFTDDQWKLKSKRRQGDYYEKDDDHLVRSIADEAV